MAPLGNTVYDAYIIYTPMRRFVYNMKAVGTTGHHREGLACAGCAQGID
jgi:hypothetical protein